MENSKENIWVCIFNPTAGTKNMDLVWKEIEGEFSKQKIKYISYFTKFHKDAINKVIDFIKKGYRKFIAAGGDGTVHEVVNAFMSQNVVSYTDLTLALIPVGTGNDWAKHHKIPNAIKEAIKLIKTEKTDFQEIGVADYFVGQQSKREYFNNVAGMAYDAYVVQQLEKRTSKPNKFIYIFIVILYILRYKLKKTKIKIGEKELINKFYTINLGVCKYSGGGMSLVPHSNHNDGLLALTYAENLNKLSVIFNSYRFYNETITNHPKIHGMQTKEARIESMTDEQICLELDGESVGHTPVNFSIIEKGLKFVST